MVRLLKLLMSVYDTREMYIPRSASSRLHQCQLLEARTDIVSRLLCPPPYYVRDIYNICIDWVGVGWRRRYKTRLSLRERDSQGSLFFVAVTMAAGRVGSFCAGKNLKSAQRG